MEEKNRYLTDLVRHEEEVDVENIINTLWQNRKKLLVACLMGAIVGLMLACTFPKVYKSGILLAPETEQTMGSGISSIASMMGVSLDNSVDAINVTMFPDIVVSTPFLFKMLDLQVETKDGLSMTLSEYMTDHQKKPLFEVVLGAPFELLGWLTSLGKEQVQEEETLDIYNLPKEERMIIRELGEAISISTDKKTGITSISVEMQDPYVATTYVDAVKENLKEYISEYRTTKSRQDVENLEAICKQRKADYYKAQKAYADFADANKNLVLLRAQAEQLKLQQEMQLAYQVYSQVATQLEGARIKEQQAKPVFVVLEQASVPLRRSFPSKPMFMLAFAFIATLSELLWILVLKDYIQKIKHSK